jgi:signal transduction histidine kinase
LLAPSPSATARLAVHLQGWLWVFGFIPMLTLLPLIYPTGRVLGPRWRVAVAASVTGMVCLAIGSALFPQEFDGTITIAYPWTFEPVARVAFVLGAALTLVSMTAAFVSLVLRLQRSKGLERRQVVVFLIATGAAAASAVAWSLLPEPAGSLVQAVAVALLPVAVGVAVTRHRLYDLDLAVCRALVVASLLTCLVGVYLTLFAMLDAVLPSPGAVPTALAAALTGVLVHPLAITLRRGVDRLFYGDRADPYAVLSLLSSRLREGVDLREVPATVCATVVGSLRLSSAELRLPGAVRPLACVGTPAGRPSNFELRHHSEVVGVFTVTPRPGELVLDARDAELLSALADQAAPALAALRLAHDVQRSREAIVGAREEERRRLRRELHDGVGAALAGVRLQLDAARELVDGDRQRRILDAAVSGVSEAVTDVRRITDDLRPPALDQLGLEAGLRALGDRLRTPALAVRVEVAQLPPLPAATEVAVYRIASEALANAVRHSGGSSVGVRLDVNGPNLVLVVDDDGHGLTDRSSSAGSGLGLDSMRQRAEEIGGSLIVESGPTGTTVTAVLPR